MLEAELTGENAQEKLRRLQNREKKKKKERKVKASC